MTPDNDDLADAVDRELRRLPMPRAPETLLPRVLEAAGAWAGRPWYTRAWFSWPAGWRAASAAAFALLVFGVWTLPPPPKSLIGAAGATRIVWDLLVVPALPYALGFVVLMGVTCVAAGLALNYVLLERAEQQ
jgi:hypothetical protein